MARRRQHARNRLCFPPSCSSSVIGAEAASANGTEAQTYTTCDVFVFIFFRIIADNSGRVDFGVVWREGGKTRETECVFQLQGWSGTWVGYHVCVRGAARGCWLWQPRVCELRAHTSGMGRCDPRAATGDYGGTTGDHWRHRGTTGRTALAHLSRTSDHDDHVHICFITE